MRTVHEMSRLSGVSVRTLHHYDAIGLLKPSGYTEAGYRQYDEEAVRRLQSILMFRELDFPLADIRRILDNPNDDREEILRDHITLLKLRREHIDRLIKLAESMMKGEKVEFTAFDTKEMDRYTKEVKERWGHTDAFRESEEHMRNKSGSEKKSMTDGLTEQFARLGKLKHLSADSPEAQDAVRALQEYITANYYTCTDKILQGLGEMYTADERFRTSIDAVGGDGTAEFAGLAIRHYCK